MSLLTRLRTAGSILNVLKGTRPKNRLSVAGDPLPVGPTFSKGEYTKYVLDTKGVTEQRRAQDRTEFSGGAPTR
jgi:hypothetical protein